MELTINDLEVGKRYVVIDEGSADPCFRGATVLGVHPRLRNCRAITIEFAEGQNDDDWLGAPWYDEATAPADEDPDLEARFQEIDSGRL